RPEVVRGALEVVADAGVLGGEVLAQRGHLRGGVEVRLVEEVQLLDLGGEHVPRAPETVVQPARPALLGADDEEVRQRHFRSLSWSAAGQRFRGYPGPTGTPVNAP